MKRYLQNICSLDNIHQWEERDSIIKESVSQHSFKVSAIAIYLLENIQERGIKLPMEFCYKAVAYATLHDFDESIIGRDISHVIKYNRYNGEEIRDALNSFVEHTIDASGNNFSFLSGSHYHAEVKKFVKLCDWIALYTFVCRNLDLGSKVFEQEEEYCRANIKDTLYKVVTIISELTNQLDLKVEQILYNLVEGIYE